MGVGVYRKRWRYAALRRTLLVFGAVAAGATINVPVGTHDYQGFVPGVAGGASWAVVCCGVAETRRIVASEASANGWSMTVRMVASG